MKALRADKPTEQVQERGTRWVLEHEEGGVKPGEAGVEDQFERTNDNLKLSSRGSVE